MVKVLHFADLHLGVENYGRPDATTGLHTRLLDFLRSLDALVEYALEERVDLVLFAGDAYRSRDPSPTHQREFARRVHRLAAAKIPVFLLVGNHDLPNAAGRANTLDIFSTLEVPYVHVARSTGAYRIATGSGDVQIVALPWLVRSQILGREEQLNLSIAEVEALTMTRVRQMLAAAVEPLDQRLPAILAAHCAAQGATYGSERGVMLGQELVLPLGLLLNAAFDYVALGHIHRHQELHRNPPVVYSGSLDRIDFGEENQPKGFVIAQVERGQASYRFHELGNTRRFITIDVLADGPDPLDQVRQAVAKEEIRDSIVRLIIHTTVDSAHLLPEQEVGRLLSAAFKVAAVVRDVRHTVRLRLEGALGVEQMTPLQALEKYLQVRKLSEERVARLLQLAQQVMGSAEPVEAE